MPQPRDLDVFSYGGGVQSTAALVLAAEGVLDCSTFIFANVGNDSEHPGTIAYLAEVAHPYAAANGIDLVEVQRTWRRGPSTGQPFTLLSVLQRPEGRSFPIPLRLAGGAPGNRSCTADWKIGQISRWLVEQDHTEANPARVGLGITIDEIERARPGVDPRNPIQDKRYPLLDLGLHRRDCYPIIEQAGLPVPPRSACWFCPFHSVEEWRRLKRDSPDLFQQAVGLEQHINQRRADMGLDKAWLARAMGPLGQVVDDQPQLPGLEEGGCDSGWCMT